MTPNVMAAIDPEMDSRPNLAPLPTLRFARFGPFQMDLQRQEVSKDGVRLKLQGKVYQVLMALLEKPGDVVTREELRQRLWPADTHVNYDANVNTTVNKLRQVLGDSTEQPIYIETIPRKGYSLVIQPDFSDTPMTHPATNGNGSGSKLASQNHGALAPGFAAAEPPAGVAIPASSERSGFWVPLGVVGLILAGMLLGAGITITTIWISHFAQVSRWP
jgi:DNA-binding winged helix-turn-helix (wHTH) protein